jgi:hypothetical protein
MPLSHPSKSKVSTSNQVQFYKEVNPLARPESFEQLPKIPRHSITRQHNRVHGCQGHATTINNFANMLCAILKKHDGATATKVRP